MTHTDYEYTSTCLTAEEEDAAINAQEGLLLRDPIDAELAQFLPADTVTTRDSISAESEARFPMCYKPGGMERLKDDLRKQLQDERRKAGY